VSDVTVNLDDAPDPFVAQMRRERAALALLPLFFVSGATGLAYQTLWARELHLVFGTSTFAIATVLAAFMAGLAAGGFVMGRFADRLRRPLAAYGWMEIGIGLYALTFPFLVSGVTPLYLNLWRVAEPPPVLFGLAQFALVGTLLLLPTALMGATLPLLARFATDRLASAGDRVGTLYGVNTAGAVFGTWLCGFVLLPLSGLWTTTLLSAGANLLLGVAALGLDRWARGAEQAEVADDLPDAAFDPRGLAVAIAAGLAGFASLTYEVVWTRVLGLMLGASVYGFSLMLLAFLIGIALGGWVGGRLADRALAALGQRGLLVVLAGIQVGVAVLSYALLFVFPELPFAYVWLYDTFGALSDALGAGDSALFVWSASMTLAVLIMTPPAVLMGAAFPMSVRAVIGSSDALGGPVGRIYGFNTAGSVLGAALAGFVLLPTLAIDGAVLLAACVNLAGAALLLVWALRRGTRVAWPALGVVGVVTAVLVGLGLMPVSEQALAKRRLLLTAGMYKYVSDLSDHSREGLLSYAVNQYDLLYYKEGVSSVVTVARNRETGNLWLANNGKVEASTTLDMPTQVLVSLLPFPYVQEPRDVLVIGLASGITAGSVSVIDDVERIDIVEIEPDIEPAARLFGEQNHYILDDPRTNLIINDARNHLLLSPEGSYDIVVSEPSNPWISGVSNLFTEEFLRMGRTRLREGGVWSQWIQMYGMDEDDLRSLIGTFARVYPHVSLYMTVEDGDLVLLGSDQPLEPRTDVVERALDRWPGMRDELRQVELDDPLRLLSTWQMDRQAVLGFVDDVGPNTDDNMRIEYSAPLNLGRDTSQDNVEALLEHARIPYSLQDRAIDRLKVATFHLDRGDFDRGLEGALRAVEATGQPEASEIAARAREVWEAQGWERGLLLTVAAGEAVDAREPLWSKAWSRWRVEMLDYFGEDEPESLVVRAGLPLGPPPSEDDEDAADEEDAE